MIVSATPDSANSMVPFWEVTVQLKVCVLAICLSVAAAAGAQGSGEIASWPTGGAVRFGADEVSLRMVEQGYDDTS